jgi:hypothetical protein
MKADLESESCPWVVVSEGKFVCKRCQDTYQANLPIRLRLFTALCDAFVSLHKDCRGTETTDEEQVRG